MQLAKTEWRPRPCSRSGLSHASTLGRGIGWSISEILKPFNKLAIVYYQDGEKTLTFVSSFNLVPRSLVQKTAIQKSTTRFALINYMHDHLSTLHSSSKDQLLVIL